MNFRVFIIILFTFLSPKIDAQQNGSWRLHYRYSISNDLAYSDTKLISATDEALLLYNFEDGLIQELDKSNALSDIGISKIDFCESEKTFIVCYNSSNIDIITDDLTITNIPDILNKETAVSKNINNIYIEGSLAYLSTDLGIIVLDIKNREIDNTYIIGNNGDPVSVIDCAIIQDTIYALTETQGLKKAYLLGDNLLDFSNWTQGANNLPLGFARQIEKYNNSLYIEIDNVLYKKHNSIWEEVFSDTDTEIISLTASEKLMSIVKKDSLGTSLKDRVLIIDGNENQTFIKDGEYLNLKLAIETKDKTRFLSDIALGLLNYTETNRISPNGKPYRSNVFAMSSNADKVFVCPGYVSKGIVAGYNLDGFYYFQDNIWNNINRYTTKNMNNIYNFIDVKENPVDKKIYCGTSSGLVVYDDETITLYDATNSEIDVAIGLANQFITGVDFDDKGNIWMVNSHTNFPLKLLTIDGEWYEYSLISGGNKKQTSIFVDSYNQKWMWIRKDGITIFPDIADYSVNHSNASLRLNIGTANLPNNTVNTVAQDRNGTIWVGTDEGIAVFDCPEDIFDSTTDCKVSRRIKSTLDQYTEYLFDTDVVNAITVDGANRKWVGTSAGLWLLDESGEDIIHSFNTENSPLPSNEIISLAINKQTGEVFIGTSLGMISFVGDATEPAEDLSNIKVFPNPVTPEYNGTISVTGLVADSYVKITDIQGTLIDDGYALGGKYVWNGKDYNGNRAKTGVYLIFSSDSKSEQKAVAKVVFIS